MFRFQQGQLLRVDNLDRTTRLGDRIEVAHSHLARIKGLLGRRSLSRDEGLLIVDSQSIHMLGMRFAIDAVFISEPDRTGLCHVVGVSENMPPWRGVVWWMRSAHSVIELPVGAVQTSRTARGDHLRLLPIGS